MSARPSTAFDGLPDAAAFGLLILISWKVIAWLLGIVGCLLLLCRFSRWVETSGNAAGEALYGGLPFALILLAVFQLK